MGKRVRGNLQYVVMWWHEISVASIVGKVLVKALVSREFQIL